MSVAAAAQLWAPLRDDHDISDARHGRALTRSRRFVDAYGMVGTDRERVVAAAIQNVEWRYDIVRRGAEIGHSGFKEYLTQVARERVVRTRQWYGRNTQLLRTALN